jgi:GT2 family glycosyltransferase
MAEPTSVAAVVVTYDALPWIEQCLDSLAGVETVVVDNGSRDETVAFVRARYPDVRVIESENRGLAAGWNIGIRETESRWVLLLNADAWLDEGALERLVELAGSRPRAAVVGPRLRNPGRSSARFGASRRRGGSPPSTSSSASSRLGRARSTRSTRAGSTTTRCATWRS